MISALEWQSVEEVIQAYKRKLHETDWVAMDLPEVDELKKKTLPDY